jgi:hypothetical protein
LYNFKAQIIKALKTYNMSLKANKIILALIVLVTLISAGLPSQTKFKNLKILPKNISENELDKIMDNYKMALGVDCGYCHAKEQKGDDLDFASDKKPEKQIARKMMTMTKDINIKYFSFNGKAGTVQAVSCITCHREKPRPEIDSIVSSKKNDEGLGTILKMTPTTSP